MPMPGASGKSAGRDGRFSIRCVPVHMQMSHVDCQMDSDEQTINFSFITLHSGMQVCSCDCVLCCALQGSLIMIHDS